MTSSVTCPGCLKRLAEGDAKLLKARYRIGSPVTVARALGQGHAMYWLNAKTLTPLCVARPRSVKET